MSDKNHSFAYRDNSRDEIIKYVPLTSVNILDVGCGYGGTGYLLKKELNATVWGVEINNEAAKVAASRLDKVIIGNFENFDSLGLPKRYFDCVLFCDILEHFKDPWAALRMTNYIIRNGGVIISSLPNVRYISNLKRFIINKDWKYLENGVLDKSHLRFFTLNSIHMLFAESGYKIERIEGINNYKYLPILRLLNLLSFGLLSDSYYLQYVCVAKKMN